MSSRKHATRNGSWILLLLISASVHAASFDCAKAKTPQEKAICGSSDLSAADDQMAAAYKSVLAAAPPEMQDYLRNSQREWIRKMAIECGIARGDLDNCLLSYENERTKILQQFKQFIAKNPPRITVNQSLRTAPLPAAMKEELAEVVIRELPFIPSPAERKRIAFDSQVTFMDLRSGEPSAILLQPLDEAQLCAPNGNGNCDFWLFQQSNGHAVLLFDDDCESISMAETVHNGMHDLVTISRSGHTPVDEFTTELHFDGKTYQPAICSEKIMGGTGGDEKDVIVAPHPCDTSH